ncbi:MAG: dTMP kinase [Candidatus Bathyarchaeia archaeon]
MDKKGVFICIEGLDASGKTTQARLLVEELNRRGFEAVYTTEPSRGEIGRFIRRWVLQREGRVPSVVEALLFAVDRIDHVEREIKPALKEGKIVVSDRYVYSSLAYQGAAGLDLDWIREINRLALTPDLAIYIDVPPETVFERIRRKKTVMEDLQTQRRVREVYMSLVKAGTLVCIDGNRPAEEVSKDILSVVTDFLKNMPNKEFRCLKGNKGAFKQ